MKRFFTFSALLSLFLWPVGQPSAHKQSAESPVHQHLAWEAFHVWPNETSHEIYTYLNPPIPWENCHEWDEQNGAHIIEGTWAEDYYDPGSQEYYTEWYNLEGLGNFNSHFWNCDSDNEETSGLSFPPGYGPFWSALKKAKMYWYGGNEVYPYLELQGATLFTSSSNWVFPGLIQLYLEGDKGSAYFYLGRIVHLLSDMGVPAHVHEDPHILENYEDYAAEHWREIRQDRDGTGRQLDLRPMQYDSLTQIFLNQAQLAQNFPSNNRDGEVTNLPASLDNGWEWNRNPDFIDLPYEDPWPVAQTDSWVDDDANLRLLSDCLIPLNMMYIANLYRLFWDTVHPFPKNVYGTTNELGEVTLAWEDPQNDNSVPTSGYTVYYGTTPGRLTEVIEDVTDTSYTFSDLVPGTRYYFSVSAHGADGEGSNLSDQLTIVVGSGLDDGPWPMFGHDARHTGQSIHNASSFPILKWKYKTGGQIMSSPAIGADGTVYVGSYDGFLYALNPDGTLKWKSQTGPSILSSSPAISTDGTIYVGSAYVGSLWAVNSDGSTKWEFLAGTYTNSSPLIAPDETIYVGSDKNVYAIDSNGELKWKFQTGSGISSSPALSPDGILIIGSQDKFLYAINPDGTLDWKFLTGSYISNSSPAIAKDGTIYIGSRDRFLYALNPDGTLKWSYNTGGEIYSSPRISTDGTIYVNSTYLYALNPDGTLKWQRLTAAYALSSPAVGGDGTVYVGHDDYIDAVNPDGTLKWEYQLANSTYSSPAIGADETLYVGCDDGYLYAIGLDRSQAYLAGIISEFGSNRPIEGAKISANGAEGYSRSTGEYILGPLGAGSHNVICEKDGYQTLNVLNIGLTEGEVATQDFELPISLSGTITDLSTGLVISGVNVSTDTLDTTQSDNEGFYSLGELTPGSYYLTFTKEGYQPVTITSVVIIEGEATSLSIELTTPGPLEIITTNIMPLAIAGEYNLRLWIKGGLYPYSYSIVSGNLPIGLSLDPTNGYIGGTPTKLGSFFFTIGIADSDGGYIETEYTIEVVEKLYGGAWPMFGANPKHTRRSTTKGPVPKEIIWEKSFRTELWTYNLTTNPSVDSNGYIYLGAHGRYSYGSPSIYVDYYSLLKIAIDGSWAALGTNSYNRYITSPAISAPSGTLFVGTDDTKYCTWNQFYALSLDGLSKWTIQGNDYRSEPALSDYGNIYFGSTDGCNVIGGKVYAANLNGDIIWEYKPQGVVHFGRSPAVGDDGNIYITGSDSKLYAINGAGILEWTLEGPNSSPAIDSAGTIYATSNEKLYALDSEGNVSWDYPIASASLVAIGDNDTIYLSGDNNHLYALTTSGALKWSLEGPKSSPALDKEGVIYICDDDQLLAIHDDGSPNIVQTLEVEGGDPIIGDNNRIYIKSSYILTCVGNICEGDLDGDRDVDGSDLVMLLDNLSIVDLGAFGADLGRSDCP